MKYRKLRIAWSVAWGVVAVPLIVLWVHASRANTPHSDSHYSLETIAPHWNMILAGATLVILPWIRFSLRTLLIAMTLIAMGLGLAVYACRS